MKPPDGDGRLCRSGSVGLSEMATGRGGSGGVGCGWVVANTRSGLALIPNSGSDSTDWYHTHSVKCT